MLNHQIHTRGWRGKPRFLDLGQTTLIALAFFGLSFGCCAQILSAGPHDDSNDLTVWPNQTSHANSDRWLVEHHDQIRRMNPRLLVVNFSNSATRPHLDKLIGDLIAAITESSRYHGYADSDGPAFLNYSVFKFVDLRDTGQTSGNSGKVPFKPGKTNGFNMEYNRFFSDDFAGNYGVKDPRNPARFLRLDELVEGGYVHEVWFLAEHVKGFGAYECVEEKPRYNERFERLGHEFVQAGNGGDDAQQWTGRSVRLGFINASRGPGCFMESLSHSFEGTATSKAIPYFTKYFTEFAGYDLKVRWGLPFDTFYALHYDGRKIEYPDEHTAIIRPGNGNEIRLRNYSVIGGNAHWPPNARGHYDLENEQPVLSTIEDWRIGSGPAGGDLAKPWTNAAFARYRKLAPDCMGAWLIYWRQNMPGLHNRQKDDDGKPMKNWWPFLFY